MKRSRCGEPPGGSLGNADPYEHTNYKLGGTGLIFKAGWERERASERERTSGAWGCRVQRLYRDIQFHRAQMRPVRGLSSFAFLFFSLFQF